MCDTYDDMQCRQMISGYFRLVLHILPETSLKNRNVFRGWEGKDGVIHHITENFGLEVKER
jgi:hypothetical protein